MGAAATEVAQVSIPDTAKAERMMKPVSVTVEWSKKGRAAEHGFLNRSVTAVNEGTELLLDRFFAR